MGEIITALIMVIISLGPLTKNNNLNRPDNKVNFVNQKKSHDPADLIWNPEPGLKKAIIIRQGEAITAFYDRNNALLGTIRQVEIAILPPIAISNLLKNYPGYEMGEIVEFSGIDKTYFVNLKNNQNNFLVKVNPDSQVSFFKSLE